MSNEFDDVFGFPSMDIFNTKPGDQVYLENLKSGLPEDAKYAMEHLNVLEPYTVEAVQIESWYTLVSFKEVPNRWFNSVLFNNL